MDINDFLGSFAQENVSFKTQIIKTASVGDNFWTAMVFVESDRFVDITASGWEEAPGLPSCKVLVVDADTYSSYATGLLSAWLYDLFCNGFTGNCILVAPAASTAADVNQYFPVSVLGTENPSTEGWYEYDAANDTYVATADSEVVVGKTYYEQVTVSGFQDAMEKAYDVLKPYAYHKTVCAGAQLEVTPEYAKALAHKCAEDEYLSGAPLLPVTNPDLSQDTLYSALKADSKSDAFMGWHSDSTRNAALYSLGLALAEANGSGTSVGNGMDMTASANITPSNGGANPTAAQKSTLKAAYVQYFKTVGDNSGNVAAETDKTIKGKVYAAYWVLSYITYMTKVSIARLITQRNFFKNAANYTSIVAALTNNLKPFNASGILENVAVTAPGYADLPKSDDSDEITIKNAWSADYVNHLRRVSITGALYINA